MAKGLPADIRRAGLAAVAGVIYLAVSPDEADGLSDLELQGLKQHGPAWVQLTELLGRVLPEGVRLPNGFTEHFTRDVLPAIDVVRSNAGARNQVRSEIRDCIGSRSCIDSLYTPGGRTFTDILERASAGTLRQTETKGTAESSGEISQQLAVPSSGKPPVGGGNPANSARNMGATNVAHIGGRDFTIGSVAWKALPEWARNNPELVKDWRFGRPLAHED
jgi:hypothetical protein